jgi:membrane protein
VDRGEGAGVKRIWQWHKNLLTHGRRLLTEPVHELSRAQRTARYAIDLVRRGWWKMNADDAQQMAAALTYRTIFGLVPFVVLALLIFRAFGGLETLGSELQQQMYHYLGLDFSVAARQPVDGAGASDRSPQPSATRPDAAATQPANAATQPATLEQRDKARAVDQILAQLSEQVSRVSFTSIGIVGVALLIWAALSLVVTAEQCFNRVFDCEVGRTWPMRVAIYWAAITLGPVLLMLSIWLTSQVTHWIDALPTLIERGGAWAGQVSRTLVGVLQSVLGALSYFAALVSTWVLFSLLYLLLPNTRVKLRPALIGAFFAAVLWEIGKWAFGLYVQNAVGYSALYGSLGLIPLFLLWLYVTWLIVLLGLELSYILHQPATERGRWTAKPDGPVLLDPRWLVPVMAIFAERFDEGEATTIDQLAYRTGLSRHVAARLTEHLKQAGYLRPVSGAPAGEQTYVPAKSADRIAVAALVALGQRLGLIERAGGAAALPGWAVIDRLGEAQGQAAKSLTLAQVVRESAEVDRQSM